MTVYYTTAVSPDFLATFGHVGYRTLFELKNGSGSFRNLTYIARSLGQSGYAISI